MEGGLSNRRVDPAQLKGEALERWYRRTPVELETERLQREQQRYDEFVAGIRAKRSGSGESAEGDGRGVKVAATPWRVAQLGRARLPEPRPRSAMAARPSRVGAPLDATGRAPAAASAGFFGRYAPVPNPMLGDGYYPGLPSPLNYVEPRVGDGFQLGDGSLVRGADEIDRIYAEQQHRMSGQGEAGPRARVRSANRLRDGFIPLAKQLETDGREADATCHPNGGWERDPQFKDYSERTKRYETQITRAPGIDYVVRNPYRNPVKFDGCAVWRPQHPLLEAKGPGYEGLMPTPFGSKVLGALKDQAGRQVAAAPTIPIEWHFAEGGMRRLLNNVVQPRPPIKLRHTPAR